MRCATESDSTKKGGYPEVWRELGRGDQVNGQTNAYFLAVRGFWVASVDDMEGKLSTIEALSFSLQ